MANVTPYAGVWIEMRMEFGGYLLKSSLPTRECGLKLVLIHTATDFTRHSLRGSVD